MENKKELVEVNLYYDLDCLIRFQQETINSIKELDGLPNEDRIRITEINQDILTVLKVFKENCVGAPTQVGGLPLAFYNNQEKN